MGKISYYCNLCGGPLTSAWLRKESGVDDGDPAPWDDECNCEEYMEAFSGTIFAHDTDEQEGEDPRDWHYCFCRSLRGYDATLISWDQIKWLDDVRMLCLKTPTTENLGPDSAGRYILTNTGMVDDDIGAFYVSSRQNAEDDDDDDDEDAEIVTLSPCYDGFYIHAACWDILLAVHRTTVSSERDLNLAGLEFLMRSLCNYVDGVVDWDDEFDYGGAAEFQTQEWIAVPGFEWLVVDPSEEVDFSLPISLSANPQPQMNGTLNAQHRPTLISSADCFAKLPNEVQLIILEMLPSKSVVDLFVASPSFRDLGTHLPNSFWKSRLAWDVPWLDSTQLRRQISRERNAVRYNILLDQLKTASSVKSMDQSLAPPETLSLKNRHRIWRNCEFILGKVEEKFATVWQQSGSVSSEIRKLSNYRSTPITEPLGMIFRCTADVYFVSSLEKPSCLRHIVAYFGYEEEIIGIEFLLYGEDCGRLFGHRSRFQQSVAVAAEPITGLAISFDAGTVRTPNRSIQGLGILSGDSPGKPRYTLGKWSDNHVVQVFHAEPGDEVIGITGEYEYDLYSITTFGIITADLAHGTPGHIDPLIANPAYHTRWINSHWPPARYSIEPRYGSPSLRQDLETPVFFLDLLGKQISSVQVYFHLGEKEEFCGFTFSFDDGTDVLVGESTTTTTGRGSSSRDSIVHFKIDEREQIIGIHVYFDRNRHRYRPSKLHGLQFLTSSNRTLSLGYTEAYNEHYKRLCVVDPTSGKRVAGLQFGLRPPVVESMGLLLV